MKLRPKNRFLAKNLKNYQIEVVGQKILNALYNHCDEDQIFCAGNEHEANGACVANTCNCDNGTGATTECLDNNSNLCSSCDSGFILNLDNLCEAAGAGDVQCYYNNAAALHDMPEPVSESFDYNPDTKIQNSENLTNVEAPFYVRVYGCLASATGSYTGCQATQGAWISATRFVMAASKLPSGVNSAVLAWTNNGLNQYRVVLIKCQNWGQKPVLGIKKPSFRVKRSVFWSKKVI